MEFIIKAAGNMKNKVIVIFNVILILTVIAGISYSHWQDSVQIVGIVKMGCGKFMIDSEKLLVPTGVGFNETHSIYYHVTSDNKSLIAECQNVDYNWTIAVGLLIKNSGTLPLKLIEIQITFNITDTSQFNITTYHYGPFPPGTNFNFPYWDGIAFEEVPPEGDVAPPIILDPDYHAIIWTIISYNGTQPLNIMITVTPTGSLYP